MATLLNGVNEVLKKTDVLDDGALLTSLTDSARQNFIDSAVQALNESLDELYADLPVSKPKQLKESTIILVDGIKDYALHSQLVTLRREYDLIDETNSHIIHILGESGYWQIIQGDLEQDDTGLPSFCAISPVNGRLYMDRAPTSTDAGRVYKYRFDKDLELTDKDDEFPFTNAVFRALVPAAAQLWKLNHQQEFAGEIFRGSLGRARKLLSRLPARHSWKPTRIVGNSTDPFQA